MVDWGEWAICEFQEPANEPPPFVLALEDDWESIPATRTCQITYALAGDSDYTVASSEDFSVYNA